jgi:hypothetical protein
MNMTLTSPELDPLPPSKNPPLSDERCKQISRSRRLASQQRRAGFAAFKGPSLRKDGRPKRTGRREWTEEQRAAQARRTSAWHNAARAPLYRAEQRALDGLTWEQLERLLLTTATLPASKAREIMDDHRAFFERRFAGEFAARWKARLIELAMIDVQKEVLTLTAINKFQKAVDHGE